MASPITHYSHLTPIDIEKSNVHSFDELIVNGYHWHSPGNGSGFQFTLGQMILDYQEKLRPKLSYPGDYWRAPYTGAGHLTINIPKLEKAEKEIAELKTEMTKAKADLLACEEKEHKTREEQEQLQAENERQKEELASLKAELDALKKKQSDDAARPFFQKLRSIF